MKENLANSPIDRQNIINNQYAMIEIEKAVGIKGVVFEGIVRFTKKQIAEFYEVDKRTIDRYLEKYNDELQINGYEVLRAKRLKKNMKLAIKEAYVDDIDVDNMGLNEKA